MNIQQTEKSKPQDQEKSLTRQQRRIIERIEKEARDTHERLVLRFMDFLVNADNPTKEILNERASEISAQWKMYCKTKRLNDSALDLVGDACNKTIKDFIDTRERNLNEQYL